MADLDEEFARYVAQTGMATAEQIRAAKFAQQTAAKKGQKVGLGEILVQQGIITASHRENVRKKLQIQSAGIQKIGRYKLIKKLGEGGMGAVYLANDPMLQRKVAIKLLSKRYAEDEEFLARFRREAQATGKLNHENIIAAYHVDEELGQHYYVMEYCEGESVDAVLKRQKVLPVNDALDIARQVARGLAYAHTQGVVHRDIKPANIFKCNSGVVKILDMGLSKNIHRADSQFSTQSGIALGTPHYIAPEQARGEKGVDGRTDMYSLGASLYHLLTGETPFQGSSPAVIMTKHLSEELPNPQDLREEVSDHVVQVIRRMMAKHPDDRYTDCGELADDLELVQHGMPPKRPALDAGRSSVAIARLGNSPLLRRALSLRKGKAGRVRSRHLLTGFVLVGAVFLGTLAGVYDILTRKKEDPTITQSVDPTREPGKTSKTPPKPKEDLFHDDYWKQSVDLLSLIDPNLDKINGEWKRDDNGLSTGRAAFGRIQIPYQPPSEYDFLIEFTRQDGAGEIKQVLSKFDRLFMWTMGASNSLCGFEAINGNDARNTQNPTRAERPNCVQNGQKHKAVVQVRNDVVRAWLDGRQLAEYSTDFSDFTAMQAWFMPDVKALGLASDGSPAIFHRARLKEVTGKGQVARRTMPIALPASSKSINLLELADVARDQVKGHWRMKDGLLYSDEYNRTADMVGVFEFPYETPEEYDYTVTFTRQQGLGDVVLAMSGGGKAFQLTVGSRSGVESCFGLINGKWSGTSNPSRREHNPLYKNGEQSVIHVQVRKDGVSAFFNGKLLTEWKTNYADMSPHAMFALRSPGRAGLGNYGNDVCFQSVQIVEFTGKGKILSPVVLPPVLASEETWKLKGIELLHYIDPQLDGITGAWASKDGALVVTHDNAARLQLPYRAPPEYDFRVTFTRLTGQQAVAQILQKGGRAFTACVGGWENRINGFDVIGGVRAVDNPRSRKTDRAIVNGRKYTALVQIRKAGTRLFLDGELQSDIATDFNNVSLLPEWTLKDLACLGIGAQGGSVAFHNIEVLEHSGSGMLLREIVKTVEPPPNDEQWRRAANLLPYINPERDAMNGKWRFNGGALLSSKTKVDARGCARIVVPYQAPEEYDLRVAFERIEGSGGVHQILSHRGVNFSWFMGESGNQKSGFGRLNGNVVDVPGELINNKRYTTIVQIRNDRIRVFVDGALVLEQNVNWEKVGPLSTWDMRDGAELGLGSDDSVTQFHAIELLPVKGQGKRSRDGIENGLWASYWSGDPNNRFKQFHFGQPMQELSFDLKDGAPHDGMPKDHFGVRFSGVLKIDQAGTYTFHSGETNDYLTILIDGEVLMNAKAPTPASKSRQLQPGLHPITITYAEAAGNARLDLKWSAGTQRDPKEIPASVLFYDPREIPEYQKP